MARAARPEAETAPPSNEDGAVSRAPAARRRRLNIDPLLGLAGLATFVVVWHLAVTFEIVSPLSVPKPWLVSQRIRDLLTDGDFHDAVQDTMWTWLVAMVMTSLVAVPTGLLMGYFAALYRPASTVIHAARAVPSTALIPIAILFFGLGFEMKLWLVNYAIFWPLVLNALYGVRAVDPQLVVTGRSLRWGRSKLLWRVILPSSAPYVATGVRVAGAIALIVVLSAELLGASRGVGVIIIAFQQNERPDFVYAGIVVVGVIGIVVNYALGFLERLVLPWAEAFR